MRRRTVMGMLAIIGFGLAGVALLFVSSDLEQRPLDVQARRQSPGAFVPLSMGVTHYELAGPETGPVVVLLHGSNVPSYIWDPTFGELAKAGFRVLRYDRLGRGLSDRPKIRYDQSAYVAQFVALLDSLRIAGPVDLAGLSLGGSIITSIAAAHPARVRSLVYVDPAFRSPRAMTVAQRTPWIAEYLLATVAAPSVLDQASDFLHPEQHPEWDARFLEFMRFQGTRRAIIGDRIANAAVDQMPELRAVATSPRPVLIVWGRQDKVVPFTKSEALRQLFPRAEFIAVDSAGHLPHIEQPTVVTSALISFLHRTNPSALASNVTRP